MLLTRSLWISGFGLTLPFFSHSFVIFNNSPMSLLKNLSNSNSASQSFSSAHSVVLMRWIFPSWSPWFNSGSAESGETCFSSSGSPNNWPNRNLAQTIQWMGSVGVFRIVQPGNVFWRGFGLKFSFKFCRVKNVTYHTLIASSNALSNNWNFSDITRSARFDEGYVGGETQPINMIPRFDIVKCIQYKCKLLLF